METSFIPLDYDYLDYHGKTYAKIIGRDKQGKRICIIDSFEPYLWAILKPISQKEIKKLIEKIEKIEIKSESRLTKIEKVEVHDKKFLGKEVKALKIFMTNYKDAHEIADNLNFPEIECRREYDIPYITKYITEKQLVPLNWYKIKGELSEIEGIENLDVDLSIKAKKIDKIEGNFEPKILAFDIEVDDLEIGKGEILMISLAGKNLKKVLTWKKSNLDFVEHYKDECEMLEAFIKYVKDYSPDILAGYFSDAFDLPYLRARAEKNNIKLNIGLDNSQPRFSRGNLPTSRIDGIVHIDLYRFIETAYSQYLESETLSLDEVSKEFLGEEKHEFKENKGIKSSKLDEKGWQDYFSYNLQDSVLTYKLAEKLWPDFQEFSRVIQEPLFNICRNGMSQNVESYILHHLASFNEIAEKRPIYDEIGTRRAREKYEGAFVLQPTPGLYENLAIFDFTSMHASIIVSFNISKASLTNKEGYESPELELEGKKQKFYFSKTPSFFPKLLEEIVEKRKQYKLELKQKPSPITKARSNAFKLLANAYYGYLGFFGARYYSIESAASTLAFVRKFNKETIEKVEKSGFKVIFSDTDSVGFTLGNKTKNDVLNLLKKLNSELPGIMSLELEDFYKRGIWVAKRTGILGAKRTGILGAKKKYALITEQGKLKIRGFETVRRDWCKLARNLQNEVLRLILNNGNEEKAFELVKKTISDLKERKIDRKEILIRTQLKKPISEYKSISPHVIAATKIKEKGEPVDAGMIIEFFIAETREKKKLVREKVKLPDEKGEYNIDYYLNNQIIPAVENIFEVFNINLKDDKKQKKLLEF